MGELKKRRIVQTRNWLDPNQLPIPDFDYEFTYPKTVYEAVTRSMEDNSANLLEELESIYRLIRDKQDIIQGGTPGKIMTWSGIVGQIGSLNVAKAINRDPVARSHNNIPTERAVGEMLDTKASIQNLNEHITDDTIHVTDVERNRWNNMTPFSSFNSHTSNTTVHVTDIERSYWNAKADAADITAHITSINNPHNVTAHQVGTYTRKEIDDTFASLRETFFNYLNINYDDRNNSAKLEKYNAANWNPNFVLSFNDPLPDVIDPNKIYFAVKPATDFNVNETDDVVIHIKKPGLPWVECGSTSLKAGDLLIKFPSTEMYVWMQGRFIRVFTDSVADDEDLKGMVWRPNVTSDGEISWILSKEKVAPTPVNIKGKDGYTPIKGIDYVDGRDGEGVPIGGGSGEILIKSSNENYDTTWASPTMILNDFVINGQTLPENIVDWFKLKNRPEIVDGLGNGENKIINQKGVTRQFEIINNLITDLSGKVNGTTGIIQTRNELHDHINDYNNPHRVTPAGIGAVTVQTYNSHITNFDNPHNVTKAHVGLGNVDNTSDADKPISNLTQIALNALADKLNTIDTNVAASKYIVNAKYEPATNILEFEFKDGQKLQVVIPITDTISSMTFDKNTQELVITLPNGIEHRIDISTLIRVYRGSVSQNIQTMVDGDVIKATIVPNSVGELEIAESVNLRNSPTTTTQVTGDRSSRIATTMFVANQVINNLISYETDRPLSANMGRVLAVTKADIDDVIRIVSDMEGVKVIDELNSISPTAALSANMGRHLDLIKAPRVHTSPSGATYGRATISLFGHARASEVDPLMDGTVFRGTDDGRYARADHRHPTDITRAPIDSPDFTGTPKTTYPPDDSDDTRIPNTAWVRKNATSTYWGTCDTETHVGDKVVKLINNDIPNMKFLRKVGSLVVIKFKFPDNSSGVRLNIQNTGFLPVVYEDKPITPYMIDKDLDHMFIFDGTSWRLINPAATGTEMFGGSDIGGTITTPNQPTGYLGFTTEGYGGSCNEDGEVNRALITIPFKTPKTFGSKVTISNGANDWALRFGDNSVIDVTSPVVISNDRTNAVIQFTLNNVYPSNSPCMLIIKRPEAFIKIEPSNTTPAFVAVTKISGVPTSIAVGSAVYTSSFYAMPINATHQNIVWDVTNQGTTDAEITSGLLRVNRAGTFTIRGTIVDGVSASNNYVETFDIRAAATGITINTQPPTYIQVDKGNITETLTVSASCGSEELTYQWYKNAVNSNSGGSILHGKTDATLDIPADIPIGKTFFYCEIGVKNDPTYPKAVTSYSIVDVVRKVKSITITNKKPKILELTSLALGTSIVPSDATNRKVIWTSDNTSVAIVSDDGVVVTYKHGHATIKAEIDDVFDEFTLEVEEFVPTTGITGIPSSMVSGSTILLNPMVAPSNATYKDITWTVATTNNNSVEISDNNKLTATGTGIIVIRASIVGANDYLFSRTFAINLTAAFVPVTNIMLDKNKTWQGIPLTLNYQVIPFTATNQMVTWSVAEDNGTGASISQVTFGDIVSAHTFKANNIGTAVIRATIVNGSTINSDYTQDFNIEIMEKAPDIESITIQNSFVANTSVPAPIVPTVVPSSAASKYTISYALLGANPELGLEIDGSSIKFTKDLYVDVPVTITIIATDNNNPSNIYSTNGYVLIKRNKVPIESLTLENIEFFGKTGYRNDLVANIVPANASNKNVVWTKVNGAAENDIYGTVPSLARVDYNKLVVLGNNSYVNVENGKKIWNFLKTKSLTVEAMFGLIGNLYAESKFNPKNLEQKYEVILGMTDDTYTEGVDNGTYTNFIKDKAGYGLAQWTYHTRKKTFLEYAQSKSVSIGNFDMQLEFIWKELSEDTSLLRDLNKATSIQEASDLILFRYERPANQSPEVQALRASYARDFYDMFVNGNDLLGKVLIRATVDNGIADGVPFVKDIVVRLNNEAPAFVSVVGFPATMFVGEKLEPDAIVMTPDIPLYRKTKIKILDGNPTGSVIDEAGRLVAVSAGTLKFRMSWTAANIPHKDVTINVVEFKKINDITITAGPFGTIDGKKLHNLNPVFDPVDASMRFIQWSVVGINRYGVSFDGNTMITQMRINDAITIRARVENGLGIGDAYVKTFNVTFTG